MRNGTPAARRIAGAVFDWKASYPSRRSPIFARNVVSTSQPLATQAGIAMLRAGGSAVDAALATAIALTVLEPCSNGLGSDLFAIVWDGRQLSGLNASGRSPAGWTPKRFAKYKEMPRAGWDTVTIPGAISGWVELSRRYGKLPFGDLFEPAIGYARDGYAVSPIIADKWAKAVPILGKVPGFAEHFLPRGRALAVGEVFSSAGLASSLEKIAATTGETFYRGELAQAMVAHAKAHGGAHALDDFARHTCDWVEPIAVRYRDYTVHEIPPNGQGIAALIALGILEHYEIGGKSIDSAAIQHLEIEAMKLAFADVYRYVADPRAMKVTPAELLDPAYLKSRARLIDRKRAQDFKHGTPPRAGTVYLTAADSSGMMVSLIQSNYMGFGSGIVVPGTGISLQNRGTGFSLKTGHPNRIGPGKRPFHTIIPGFVMREGKPYASIGVMGGPIQPQGHVQTLVRMLDDRQQPQTVLDAPRWKVNVGLSIDLEAGISPSVQDGLAALGHRFASIPDSYMDFGAGQIIVRNGNDGYVAASDPRRDGQAAGF
jgi:gamma-glutamyltranspeptidase / glutathione hydrolase